MDTTEIIASLFALADRWARVKPNDSEWSQGEAFAMRSAAASLRAVLEGREDA